MIGARVKVSFAGNEIEVGPSSEMGYDGPEIVSASGLCDLEGTDGYLGTPDNE